MAPLTSSPEGDPSIAVVFPDDARNVAPGAPRGTAVGRSVSAPEGGRQPIDLTDDRGYKGTLHGHMLHLPDLPEIPQDVQPATVLAEPSPTTAGQFTAVIPDADFSTSKEPSAFDNSFDPSELDRPRKRGRLFARAMIFVSVISLFVIAAVLWVRWHRTDVAVAPVPVLPTAATQVAEPAPTGLPPPSPGGEAAAGVPAPTVRVLPKDEPAQPDEVVAPSRGAAASQPRPTPVDQPSYVGRPTRVTDMPTRAEGKPPERQKVMVVRRRSTTVEPATPRPVHVVPALPPKPTHPIKRPDEDPDGTLPPSE
jgi:hypothetical protein